MELVILNQSNFAEMEYYSGYSTLAWNIGYPKSGDFQMRSYDVEETLNLMGEGDIIGNNLDYTVMLITEVRCLTDGTGTRYVEVRGETPLNVFNRRPAVQKIVSITSYDANYPNGWFYGDKLSETREVDPLQVTKEILQAVDVSTYGQLELSYLSLPFTYIDLTNDQVTSRLQYYEVSGTAGDAIEEMCEKGEFGLVVMRQDPEFIHYSSASNSRRLACYIYKPQWGEDDGERMPEFSYLYDDYISSEISYTTVNNVYIQPREDDVVTTSSIFESLKPNGARLLMPRGLTAWVKYDPKEIEGLDGWEYNNAAKEFESQAYKEAADRFNVSVETNGVFPFHHKSFKFLGEKGSYFVGDYALIRVPEATYEARLQVVNFIRTFDQNGYREYPEFKNVRDGNFRLFTTVNNWN